MTFKQIELAYGTDAARIGRYYSNKFKGRAIEILKKLAKKYPIESLIMGMGIWAIRGGKMDVKDEGWDEVYQLDVDDLIDWARYTKTYTPVNATSQDRKLIEELIDILDTLTDDSDLTIFDWKKKP